MSKSAVEIAKSYDVVIIGAGTAGVLAAIAAKKSCNKVLLIEKSSLLGGLATSARVGTLCGLYANTTDNEFNYNIGRTSESFADELVKLSQSAPLRDNTGLKFIPYSPDILNSYCERLLRDSGVDVWLNSELIQVKHKECSIKSILIETVDRKVLVDLNAIIDSSGSSIVSRLSGLEMIKTDFQQSASQIFSLTNVGVESEGNLSLLLLTSLRKAVMKGELDELYDRVYLVPGSMKNGEVALKLTIPFNEATDQADKGIMRRRAVEMITEIVEYLVKNVKSFRDTKLKNVAREIGIRVEDRAKGLMVLSEEMVVNCKKFESGIARGNWPLEIWSESRRVEIRPIIENDYYEIPAQCLVSAKISNLFFAGRTISADDNGIASARVIGACLQTGYAAGKIAAGFVNKVSFEEVIENIRKEEFANG